MSNLDLTLLRQVPRERRRACSSAHAIDPADDGVNDGGTLETVDEQRQAHRSMPVNLSLSSSSSSSEHQPSQYAASGLAGHTRGVKCNVDSSAVKAEEQPHMRVLCSGEMGREESREHSRMVYEQSHYDLPLAAFLKEEQKSRANSTDAEDADEEVRHSGMGGGEDFTWVAASTQLKANLLPLKQIFHRSSSSGCPGFPLSGPV